MRGFHREVFASCAADLSEDVKADDVVGNHCVCFRFIS